MTDYLPSKQMYVLVYSQVKRTIGHIFLKKKFVQCKQPITYTVTIHNVTVTTRNVHRNNP